MNTEEAERNDVFPEVTALKKQRQKNILKRFINKLRQISVRSSVPESESFEYFYEEKLKEEPRKPFKIKKEL